MIRSRVLAVVFIHLSILCFSKELRGSPVYHSANTQRCSLFEKKSGRGSLLTLSAEFGPISLGINAQRGTSIVSVAQRPRNSVSQPRPFTVPWPLSLPPRQYNRPPPLTRSLSPKLLPAGALLRELLSNRLMPLCPPQHDDIGDDKRNIRREKYRRSRSRRSRRRRTTALDLKRQQRQLQHLVFQHLVHAVCGSRSVHDLGSTEPRLPHTHQLKSSADRTAPVTLRAAIVSQYSTAD